MLGWLLLHICVSSACRTTPTCTGPQTQQFRWKHAKSEVSWAYHSSAWALPNLLLAQDTQKIPYSRQLSSLKTMTKYIIMASCNQDISLLKVFRETCVQYHHRSTWKLKEEATAISSLLKQLSRAQINTNAIMIILNSLNHRIIEWSGLEGT